MIAEVARITGAMDASGYDYELLCLDDAPPTRPWPGCTRPRPSSPSMSVVPFRRNGGSGTVRRIGTQRSARRDRRVDRRRHDLPERADPRVVGLLETDLKLDQVVGARTTEQGTYKFLRVPAKWSIRKIAEVLTARRSLTSTPACGPSGARSPSPAPRPLPPGFSCVTTITFSFLLQPAPPGRYIPIDYYERAGTSKFNFFKDAYRYILQVLQLILPSYYHHNYQ